VAQPLIEPAQVSALLSADEVATMLRCHKATLWRWMQKIPDFPHPIRVGLNNIAFHEHEINAYIASRPRTKDSPVRTTPNRKNKRR
jgi:predicted DNA-binding transcriptional regulator AlpA